MFQPYKSKFQEIAMYNEAELAAQLLKVHASEGDTACSTLGKLLMSSDQKQISYDMIQECEEELSRLKNVPQLDMIVAGLDRLKELRFGQLEESTAQIKKLAKKYGKDERTVEKYWKNIEKGIKHRKDGKGYGLVYSTLEKKLKGMK